MKVRMGILGVMAAVTIGCNGQPPSSGAPETSISRADNENEAPELRRLLDRLMTPPEVRTEPGFTARLLVHPGRMFDPLFMVSRGEVVWINDDGGEEGRKGSQILAIDGEGQLSTVVPLGEVLPVTGFDIAPASFAPYGGQVFSVAFPDVGLKGAMKANVIQRIELGEPRQNAVFCTLPSISKDEKGVPTAAVDARFGPEGTPFGGKFFSITALNYTVYQTTADGRCTPFVTLDKQKWGIPQGLTFTPDGQYMLVSAYTKTEGSIVRVRADGSVEAEPLARGEPLHMPAGMAYAPQTFAGYGGQLFIAVFGIEGYAIQKTQPIPAKGRVYRLTPQGELQVFVSQLQTPQGLHFAGDRLLVSDVNGDFIAGGRELPDGFVVEITQTQQQE